VCATYALVESGSDIVHGAKNFAPSGNGSEKFRSHAKFLAPLPGVAAAQKSLH